MDDLLTSYPPAEEAPQLQSAPGLGPQIPNPMLQSAPGLNQPRPPPEPPQEFTQADSLRAQRLQAGLSAAQSQVDDGTLAPEEGAQLQQHINRVLQPLRQRQQQTQARQRQQMKAQLMDETALQESMEAQHAKLAAQAFPETVSQFTDPMSGRTEHFYQHRRGEWKPIEYGVDQQERDRRAEDLRQLSAGDSGGTGPGQDPTLEQMVEQVRQEPARPPEAEGEAPAWQDQSDPAPSVDYFPLGLASVLGQADAPPAGDSSEYGQFIRRLAEKNKAQQPQQAPRQQPQAAPPPAELDEAEKALVTKEITQRLGPRPQVPQPDFSQPLPPNWRQIQAGYQHAQHQWDASWQHLHDQWRQDKRDRARADDLARRQQQGQDAIAERQQKALDAREQAKQQREDAQKAKEEAKQALKDQDDHYLKVYGEARKNLTTTSHTPSHEEIDAETNKIIDAVNDHRNKQAARKASQQAYAGQLQQTAQAELGPQADPANVSKYAGDIRDWLEKGAPKGEQAPYWLALHRLSHGRGNTANQNELEANAQGIHDWLTNGEPGLKDPGGRDRQAAGQWLGLWQQAAKRLGPDAAKEDVEAEAQKLYHWSKQQAPATREFRQAVGG